jgi:hypothetical protein
MLETPTPNKYGIFFVAMFCAYTLGLSDAYACDPGAARINRDWLKTNNASASSAISTACSQLNGHEDSGALLEALADAFNDGQKHNPSAQQTIDGCGGVTLVNALCP